MLKWLFGNKRDAPENAQLPAYEESRAIAESGSVEKRRWLASQQGLQPEFLYLFATDRAEDVRVAVAGNEYTPLQADKILATDESEEVRQELAVKVGKLMPTLDSSRGDKVVEMVLEVIALLARDRSSKVRQIVAEEIKSLDTVPREIVKQLAWDVETVVSAPILEFSPLLNERQLIEIIRSGVEGGALEAVARRHRVSARLSDALIEERHDGSIVRLLENDTAAISEDGFQTIADVAADSEQVLESMIERDDLTLSTIRHVATFVGNAVINRILERNKACPGLDSGTVRDIRQKVRERVMSGDADDKPLPGEEARQRAEQLFGENELTEQVIMAAVKGGDRWLAIHSMALLGGLQWNKVRNVLGSNSGKTIAALCWKAGLSARCSVHIQKHLARLSGSSVVHGTASGDYTMSESELEWYLEFFD